MNTRSWRSCVSLWKLHITGSLQLLVNPGRLHLPHASSTAVDQGIANFFYNGSVGNILGSTGQMVPVTTTQLWHCRWKVAIDNLQPNRCACVSIKLYYRRKDSRLDLAYCNSCSNAFYQYSLYTILNTKWQDQVTGNEIPGVSKFTLLPTMRAAP